MNISFCEQYSFKDLIGDYNLLKFDFAILDTNNDIICLIEY